MMQDLKLSGHTKELHFNSGKQASVESAERGTIYVNHDGKINKKFKHNTAVAESLIASIPSDFKKGSDTQVRTSI